MNRQFTEEEIQIIDKKILKMLTFTIIRKVQIKVIIACHILPIILGEKTYNLVESKLI